MCNSFKKIMSSNYILNVVKSILKNKSYIDIYMLLIYMYTIVYQTRILIMFLNTYNLVTIFLIF